MKLTQCPECNQATSGKYKIMYLYILEKLTKEPK